LPVTRKINEVQIFRFRFESDSKGARKLRGRYQRQGDEEMLSAIHQLSDAGPTYGYRRITALLNRARRASGAGTINHKRVFRLMAQGHQRLQAHVGSRPVRAHEGSVIAAASNQRWSSDRLEIACWNGGIVRDLMLAGVKRRFHALRAPHPVQWLPDNGSAYTPAGETLDFAAALGLVPCFTLVRSPESNGASEAFVKTLKRDYARIQLRPDALTVLQQLPSWNDGHNENRPHSGLRTQSPREFIQSQSQPASRPV
jgi:putative transposase